MKLIQTKNYLFIIDEEAEIKENDKFLADDKYIVTCDEKVSESFINGNFYRSKSAKIIAYYPLKESKELNGLPLLPNPFEEEVDIKRLAKDMADKSYNLPLYPISLYKEILHQQQGFQDGVVVGYKLAQSKQFSLEDMKKAIEMATHINPNNTNRFYNKEEIIQLISIQRLSEFIPEYEYQTREGEWKSVLLPSEWFGSDEGDNPKRLKIVNSMGKKMLVGKYK